jgi:hypothetical protein
MFDYKTVLGAVAAVIGIISYAPYLRDIFLLKTKPHFFSWFIWSILTGVAFIIQVITQGGPGAWVTGFTALICLFIAGLAIQYGEKRITVSDWFCFVGALLGIILWLTTENPVGAVIIITLTDALAFVPTFRKTYFKPQEETLVEYAFASLKFLIGLFALSTFNLTTALYPASLVFMNGLFVTMALARRKQLSGTSQ